MSIPSITMSELILRDYNPQGISNRYITDGLCVKCNNKFEYSSVKKFLRNRITKPNEKQLWQTCSHCWLILHTSESKEWAKKNRDAQLIAQNKPEQKIKNALGVSKSWNKERSEKASEHMRKRWKNDDKFRETALKNILWTQKNDERFKMLMRKSIGNGGLKGTYNEIDYDSALELSYILYCNENNISIKRYDLEAIEYTDENNKSRMYIPDFIIDNSIIIEIKGLLFYKKNYLRTIKKLEYLKLWTEKNNYKYKIIFGDEPILKKYYNKARKIHHENKKQKNDTL